VLDFERVLQPLTNPDAGGRRIRQIAVMKTIRHRKFRPVG